jgi:hypothetical protein
MTLAVVEGSEHANSWSLSRTRFIHDFVHVLFEVVEKDRGIRPAMDRKDVGFGTDKEIFGVAGGMSGISVAVSVVVRGDIHRRRRGR